MVRTKLVAKRRTRKSRVGAGTNGTPKNPGLLKTQATPQIPLAQKAKSPSTQPVELSESDKLGLREFLDHSDKPFEIATIPASRKRKRSGGVSLLQIQDDLFEERLSIHYEVKPRQNWESLKKYKKFTVGDRDKVGNESIGVGQCVLVKHDQVENAPINLNAQWKAKVLEVRALDSEHVYIRVVWLNRPEDLEIGRKDYHGKNELIPTNQMDIIDAGAVNGSLNVMYWDETADGDESLMPPEDEFFWRYTYDFVNTKSFSELRKICKCNTPQNPDELIVSCSNGECRKWMHAKCVAEEAARNASGEGNKTPKTPKTKGKRKSRVSMPAFSPNSKAVAIAKSPNGTHTAELFIKGHPDRASEEPAERDELVVTDPHGVKRSEEVRCLFCASELE